MIKFNFTQWAKIQFDFVDGELIGFISGFEGGQWIREFRVNTWEEVFNIIDETFQSKYLSRGLINKLFKVYCH